VYLFHVFAVLFLLIEPASIQAAQLESEEQREHPAVNKEKKAEEENREKEAEEAKRLTELYLRNQSVFLRKGEFMLELDQFYYSNDRTDFIPVGTGAVFVKDTRTFYDTTLIARYGVLTDGLEVDLIAPVYVRAEVKSDAGVASATQKEDGFGDLAAAIRYQAWYERGARPSLVVDMEGKSRTGGTGLTGTGTWNMGGGLTLIKTIDPVVLFARLGYTYNFASQTRDLGNIINYRLGMGFSLNDRVSFNIQLIGTHIAGSKFTGFGGTPGGAAGSGPVVFSSQSVRLMNAVFTTTILVTKNLFIEPLIGIGMTEQSFAMFGVRIPYRF